MMPYDHDTPKKEKENKKSLMKSNESFLIENHLKKQVKKQISLTW